VGQGERLRECVSVGVRLRGDCEGFRLLEYKTLSKTVRARLSVRPLE
jgi:hypothetical protein